MESSLYEAELATLQRTRQVLIKFLEYLRSIKNDVNTVTTNYENLKHVNDQWITLLKEINTAK